MEDEILDVMNYLIEEIENNLDKSSSKRDNDSEKVLNDLECLAHQVEERLQAIENTERELDQWRDQQLQKNRDFWDEYRRQIENFSACRIRNLQYAYRIKEIRNETILKRVKRAKYLYSNLDKFGDQLNDFIKPELIYSKEFQLFLFNYDFNSSTIDLSNELFEQLSNFDSIIFPNEDLAFNEQIQ